MVRPICIRRSLLRGKIAVLKGIPKGFVKSAVTAYQSAKPPIIAAPDTCMINAQNISCRCGYEIKNIIAMTTNRVVATGLVFIIT